jgi:hypothetical protein
LFALAFSAAVGVLFLRAGEAHWSMAQRVMLASAGLSLLWTVAVAVPGLATNRRGARLAGDRGFAGVARIAALLFGVASAVILAVALVTRTVYVGIDLLYPGPPRGGAVYGFGLPGLWSLGALFASCTLSLLATRDRRLFTAGLWVAVMATVWGSVLLPTPSLRAAGSFQRGGGTLSLMAGLAFLLASTAVVTGWVEKRRRRGAAASGLAGSQERQESWPGLIQSCVVLAVAVLLGVCYHLAVPVSIGTGGFRASSLIATGSAGLGAWAAYLLVSRAWNGNLADAAMGLASLMLCAFAVSLVPSRPTLLAERYPMIFSAAIIGLGLATALWTWLSVRWRQQMESGRATATADLLIPRAKRFAFLSAALALLIGVLLAAWPRLRGISATDDEIGQVTAGLAADLFLLLVILWSSRQLRRLTFHILAVLALLSTAGFLLVRMLPFSPGFG